MTTGEMEITNKTLERLVKYYEATQDSRAACVLDEVWLMKTVVPLQRAFLHKRRRVRFINLPNGSFGMRVF